MLCAVFYALYWHADNCCSCCSDFDVCGYCQLHTVLSVIGVLHLAHGEILLTIEQLCVCVCVCVCVCMCVCVCVCACACMYVGVHELSKLCT